MKEKIIEILTDLQEFISMSSIEKELGLSQKSIQRALAKNDLPPEVVNYFTGLVQKWAILPAQNTAAQNETEDPAQNLAMKDAFVAGLQRELKSLKAFNAAMVKANFSEPEGPEKPTNVRIGSMRAFLGIQDKDPYDPSKNIKKGYGSSTGGRAK